MADLQEFRPTEKQEAGRFVLLLEAKEAEEFRDFLNSSGRKAGPYLKTLVLDVLKKQRASA
jgi:hypothetical protein